MNECRGPRLGLALTVSLLLHAAFWWLQPVQPPTLSTAGPALQIRLLPAALPETDPARSPAEESAADTRPADSAPQAPPPHPEPPIESAIETASASRQVVEPEPPGQPESRPEPRQAAPAVQSASRPRPEARPQRRPSSPPAASAPPARSEPVRQTRTSKNPAPPADSSTDATADAAATRSTPTGDELNPAKVLTNPKPDYPRQARRRGLEGQVVLEVEVRVDGRPGRIDIVASSGHAVLDQAALEGLRRWRFQPARRGGRSVDATLRVPVSFRLN